MVARTTADHSLYILTLIGVFLAGATLRLANLDAGSGWHDYDEGVHLSATLLLTKGYTPYVDYFFAHPPLPLYILSTIVDGGGSSAYASARMISAIMGTLTLLILAVAAYLSLGKAAALAGTAFLALDGYTSFNSRMVMLEPYTDFFLSISVLTYILVIRARTPLQETIAASASGIALGLAAGSKMSSLFGIAAIFLHALIFRRTRIIPIMMVAAASTYLLISARFLLADADLYLRQTILFHIVRPPDGVPVDERPRWMLTSLSDIGVMWAGIPALIISLILVPRLVRSKMMPREAYLWIMWSASYLIAFSLTKTFFGHYIQHVITPLSYVAALPLELINKVKTPPWKGSFIHIFATRILPIWTIFMIILQAGVVAAMSPPSYRDDTPLEVSKILTELGANQSKIIAFEPIYTFLLGIYPANMVIDSYGHMMFEGMGLGGVSFFEALQRYLSGDLYYSWPIYETKVQEKITADILSSDFVIIDWRARWQLIHENLYEVYSHSTCLHNVRGIEICRLS